MNCNISTSSMNGYESGMSCFAWKDSPGVGIASINNEHEQIIDYIDRLHVAGLDRKSLSDMWTIPGGLVEYTMTHFLLEEAL